MVASSCLGGPGTAIKYPMDMVCSGWGLGPHTFRLDGGQASHCSVVVVSVMPVWPGVCVCLFMCIWAASDRMSINRYPLLS